MGHVKEEIDYINIKDGNEITNNLLVSLGFYSKNVCMIRKR